MGGELNLLPILLGFVAGVTVYIGALALYRSRESLSRRNVGFLQAFAGGILGYIALDIGEQVGEYFDGLAKPATLGSFLLAVAVTTAAMLATFLVLSYTEGAMRRGNPSSLGVYTGYVVSTALGVHNVGEGFAIAASLLSGAVASALLFTTGFAIHNATEGFAVVGPILGETRGQTGDGTLQVGHTKIFALSMLAGLPTVLGAAVFYTGVSSQLFLVTLDMVALASIVYATLHVNLSALSRLGGVSSPLFWVAITAGVAAAFSTESVLLFSGI